MFLRRYCNLIELHWTISSSYNQRVQRIIHLLHNMEGFYCMSIFIDFFPVECRYWPNESTCNSLRHGKSWTIKARLAVVFRLFGREYGANFSTNHKVWSKAKSWKLRVILDSQLKSDDLLTYFVPLKKYVHPLCRLVTAASMPSSSPGQWSFIFLTLPAPLSETSVKNAPLKAYVFLSFVITMASSFSREQKSGIPGGCVGLVWGVGVTRSTSGLPGGNKIVKKMLHRRKWRWKKIKKCFQMRWKLRNYSQFVWAQVGDKSLGKKDFFKNI